jgi:brefeldin A-inhibited guanine nucleotide-exchange protein
MHPDDVGNGDAPDVPLVTEESSLEEVAESSFVDQRRVELQTELDKENEMKKQARDELAKEIENNNVCSNDSYENPKEVEESKESSFSFQSQGIDGNEDIETISVASVESVDFVDEDVVAVDAKDADKSALSEDDSDLDQLEVDKVESSYKSKDSAILEKEGALPVPMDEESVTSLVKNDNEDKENQESLEHMRPEVLAAVECYCAVINNSLATAKMIEIALECIGLLISNRYVVGSTIISQEEADAKEKKESFEDRRKISDIMDLISSICECADNPTEAVQSAMSKDLLSLMTSPVCKVHEAGMLKSVRTVFHMYLITKHEEAKLTCRAVLQDMLKSVFQRMEAYDAISNHDYVNSDAELPNGKGQAEESNSVFASRFHTDSYLLFRALCKLSAKTLPEDLDENASPNGSGNIKMFSGSKNGASDPMATETKILSLELILCIFEHSGPAFRNGSKFIYAVQNFLCVSLLKNCISSNTRVAHLSLQIFLLLVCCFFPFYNLFFF